MASILVFILAGYFYLEQELQDNLLVQGEAQLNNIAISIMNTSVSETLKNRPAVENLLKTEKDEQGRISMVSADAAEMNEIVYECVQLAQEKIYQLEQQKISIPLGNALGSKLFSGMGPELKVGVLPMGAVSAEYFTEFYAAGINQTQHRVCIRFTVEMSAILPGYSTSVDVTEEVCVAQTLIVGQVPE